MNANILGSYLKRKRMESGLAQIDVAEKLGYTTPQYISNFERGTCQPSLKILTRLADIYQIDIKEFFDVIIEQQKFDLSEILFANRRKPRRKTGT